PALRHEGPRLYQGADRARDRGEMQRAGADRRSAGVGAASPGHQERHDGAAGMVAVKLIDFASKPGWIAGVMRGKRRTFVDTVGGKIEIMFDSGIRSGQDVMRALALGAKSCMIGRAFVHGLGAGGEAGVTKALDLIRNELTITMGLCGVNTIAEIDDHVMA